MDSAGNVHIADTGDNRLRKVAPGGAHNGAGSALCGHRPRVRQFRQSLHRRVHCLSPLPHDARWDHHALRRHEFQYRVGGPPCRRLRTSWTILRRGGRSVRHCLRRRPGRPTPAHHQQLPSLESIFRRGPRSGQRRAGEHQFLRSSTRHCMETTRRAPALKGLSTVPLRFRRLPNSRAEAETDDAPPPIASRDVILPSQYDSA